MAKNQLQKAYNYLISRGLVSDKADFAQQLGYNRTYFSEVFNGGKPVTAKIAQVLNQKFNISKDWLLNGKGTMGPDIQEPDADYENAYKDPDEKVKILRIAANIMNEYADELEHRKKRSRRRKD